ncbi:Alpha-l1 nicotinic acetyl choline receptor [Dirofilaria immitis]|nr:Alpha-l1 nicotinic acetyl choline receptor [Dirofilaria immitis]
MSEPAVPPVLSRITIATTYHSREEPTSKDQKATSLWALGCHKPVIPVVTFLTPLARNLLINSKGSIGHAFAVCIRTGNQDQASFCPFTLREVSVLSELALGHLRYILTDVPPQSNSPPDTVFGAKHWAEIRDSQRPQGPSVSSVLIRQSDSPSPCHPTGPVLRANPYSEVTDLICRLPSPTLFYRLEAVHLGDLLRIWLPSDFHGSNKAHEAPQEPWRFTETTSLSPAKSIPGSPFLNQKRELWLGLSLIFRVHLRYRATSFSKISLEYLLLPPRFALMEAPIGPTPKIFNVNHCQPLIRSGHNGLSAQKTFNCTTNQDANYRCIPILPLESSLSSIYKVEEPGVYTDIVFDNPERVVHVDVLHLVVAQ